MRHAPLDKIAVDGLPHRGRRRGPSMEDNLAYRQICGTEFHKSLDDETLNRIGVLTLCRAPAGVGLLQRLYGAFIFKGS
jgi:hypothetical protein